MVILSRPNSFAVQLPVRCGLYPNGVDSSTPPAIYVDSVSGSDSNSGLSSALPKLTLASAKTAAIAEGLARFNLKRGSTWRESFVLTGFTAPQVSSYGTTGALPIIDGSDVATTWTAHATEANVWEKSGWTHDATGSNRLTIYEDGQLLTRVTTAAACSALPRSFVDIKGSDGSPLTLRIHATGSGNPNSNGKVYEAAKRSSVFSATQAGVSANGVETQRQISNNGSFEAGVEATINSVLATDGTKHNFFMASGVARDCIAFAADPPTSYELSNTLFVSFLNDPSAASFVYERCGAVQPSANGEGGTAILAHGNPNPYLAGTLRQFWVLGKLTFSHPTAGATVRANCITEGCYSRAGSFPISHGVVNSLMGYGELANASANNLTDATLTDCAIYIEERYNNGNYDEFIRMAGSGSRVLTNCAFACQTPANTNFMANSTATGGTLSVTNTIIHGYGNLLWLDSDVTYTGNYNIFWTANGSRDFQAHDGAGYQLTLAAWQSGTGQDAQSVRCAAADQVAGGANALWLAYAQASGGTSLSTIGPAVGDWRINPSARVYSGAGTAYIGTFPDLVPITNAGPQNRWDWNTRASASGAPTAWPTVPTTLAESRAYVLSPTDWNFYP